jgi:hypothetical protein
MTLFIEVATTGVVGGTRTAERGHIAERTNRRRRFAPRGVGHRISSRYATLHPRVHRCDQLIGNGLTIDTYYRTSYPITRPVPWTAATPQPPFSPIEAFQQPGSVSTRNSVTMMGYFTTVCLRQTAVWFHHRHWWKGEGFRGSAASPSVISLCAEDTLSSES